MKDGFIKVKTISPKILPCDVCGNVERIVEEIKKADDEGVNLLVTPELSITGFTVGDLVFSDLILTSALEGLKTIVEVSEEIYSVIVVGLPFKYMSKIYNVAAVVHGGTLLGLVPKTNLPNYMGFSEKRYFASASTLPWDTTVFIKSMDIDVPFSSGLVFMNKYLEEYTFSVELCEDLWAPITPSSHLALGGANVLLNCSASSECIGKASQRRKYISSLSSRLISAYAYSNAGMYEDTSENVYSAHCIISECGQILGENKPFSNDGECTAIIDLKKISYLRSVNTTFENKYDNVRYISFEQEKKNTEFSSGRFYKNPFTKDSRQIGEDKFCEIVNISAAALASRIRAKAPQRLIYKAQDSANDIFTVYCAIKALEISKMEQCTLCVLKNNSRNEIHSLFKKFGATVCDTADTENSLLIKGNDLLDYALYSVERAEGETYALNASLSKCTVLCCVAHICELLENKVFEGLINDLYKESYTPRTDLLEFILFYSFRFGFSPAKILRLALKAFEGDFNKDQILETMADFYKRFFDNQSVRWNMPEGAKAASLSLLSKTDFRIPSCVCIGDWIREIEELKSN